jgi:hypothetical protein
MIDFAALTPLIVASLVLAAAHVSWNFLLGTFTSGELRVLEAGREKIRQARSRQADVERHIQSASQRLDDMNIEISRARRNLESDMDRKMRFEILIGRAAPNFTRYFGAVAAPARGAVGRDKLIWINQVGIVIWAPTAERARVILQESFPRSAGFESRLFGTNDAMPVAPAPAAAQQPAAPSPNAVPSDDAGPDLLRVGLAS